MDMGLILKLLVTDGMTLSFVTDLKIRAEGIYRIDKDWWREFKSFDNWTTEEH